MYSIPADVLATWPAPNYENPVTRNTVEVWLFSGVFLFLTSLCVGTRMWARIFVRKWFGFDDLFILLAYLCTIVVTALVAVGESRYEWNRHIWDVNPELFQVGVKNFYIIRIFWSLAASFIRFSILCLYYRLIHSLPTPRHYIWILNLVTVFNVSLFLVYILTSSLLCKPIQAYWIYPPLPAATCIDDALTLKVSGVLNTFAEFLIAVLPLIAVFQLRVNRPWTVIGLLSLGLSVVIVGCFRTYYIFKAVQTYDWTWWSAAQWICSEVENNTAIICACAVPLRPVVGRIVQPARRSLGLPKHSTYRSSKDSNGTDTEPKFNQNHSQADIEEVMEWTSIVENLVDLEGIANDGLGYTVSITGPDRPSPKGRKWLRVPRMNLLHPTESSRRAPPVTTRGLAIPLKTEVVINESWRSTTTAGRGSRHGSANDIPATDMTIDAAIGHIFPEYLGDSSMLTPEPAEDPTPQKVADSSGRGSNGSISMSPAKPGSGNRVNNQGTVR